MSLPNEVLSEIQGLLRKPSEWFSIAEIKERRPELFATEYIQRTTGKHISVSREPYQVLRDLVRWAAGLLEREVRRYELMIAEVCADNSAAPSPEDDAVLVNTLTQYIKDAVPEVINQISTFMGDTFYKAAWQWSGLNETGKRLASEISVTIRLAGEIARLELIESGDVPLDRTGFSQPKIERFCSQYSHIPHPFDVTKRLNIPQDRVRMATRLLIYVVFHEVTEHRLRGFESKFVSAFLRYLTCPRDLSASAVEQVAALFEPFLKKAAFLFNVRDAASNPIWPKGLDGLISGLNLTSADLKDSDEAYWRGQTVEGSVFRLAYQLRHKGAHEAHDYAYYERERNAYFVFAAMLISCKLLMDARPDADQAVAHQGDVEAIRDLFVKIGELIEGSNGPRDLNESSAIPSRFEKLLTFSRRAQAIWPTCSAALAEGLQSEYLAVKYELAESDREADIDSYLESRADDY